MKNHEVFSHEYCNIEIFASGLSDNNKFSSSSLPVFVHFTIIYATIKIATILPTITAMITPAERLAAEPLPPVLLLLEFV